MTLHSRIARARELEKKSLACRLEMASIGHVLADDCEKLLEKVGAFLDEVIASDQKLGDYDPAAEDNEYYDGVLATRAREFKKELGIE